MTTDRRATDGDGLIQLRGLVKTYVSAAGAFPALRGVDLDFHEGEFVSVVGRSGSGKSTLLNMLTGIDRPTSGSVHIAGTDIHRLREGEMARWRGHNMGIVFQFYQLLPTLSLIENTMLPMDLCSTYPREEREERALELLGLVGLREHAYKMPGAVSGGQQQCAALARALANDPPIIVADEPTGNLDSRAADAVVALLEGAADRGKTVIMVTHDPRLARRASRTVMLADGRVVDALGPAPRSATKRGSHGA
jgi:putative ABC transport system ATP-binding protein